jgi:CRP/FNR family transcriptional regulator
MTSHDPGAKILSIPTLKAACQECSLNGICLSLGLSESDMKSLAGAIKSRRRLKKGEYVSRMGDPFRALYAISSGSTKTCEIAADGGVQITAFHLPGELLGLDAISAERYPSDIVALETTDLCELPFERLEALALEVPGLQHQLFRIMSREVLEEEKLLLMLGRMSAEERLAAFLLNFSKRHQQLGSSATELRLPMSRQDLGDYLGLALETVSRLFSRFQEEGLIRVQGRQIKLHNLAKLREVTQHLPASPAARA